MMHLSRLQGATVRILSTSSLESKEKRIRWSPINFILNPVLGLHRGLKVFAMASRLIGRLVRKRATMENSVMAWFDFRAKPEPSFLIGRGISSGLISRPLLWMWSRGKGGKRKKVERKKCSPVTQKRYPTSLRITMLSPGTKLLQRGTAMLRC